jgi:O-antigen/teichoic acid export membrane protein
MMRKKSSNTVSFGKVDDISEVNIVKAAKDSSEVFFGQIFSYVIRFAFGVLVARALGADGYGLYSLGITTTILLASVSRLGISDGIVHFLPRAVNQRDEPQILGILRIGVAVPAMLSFLIAIILFLAADFIANNVFDEPALGSTLRWLSITIPILALARIVMAFMRGFKNMRYGVIVESIAFETIRFTVSVILFSIGFRLAGALWAYIIAWTVSTILSVFFFNRIFSLNRSFRNAKFDVRKMLSFSAPISLTRIINQLKGNIVLLMLGMFSTISSVGVYSVAIRVQSIGTMFMLAVRLVAMPIISELYHQGDFNRISQFYQTLSRWSLTFGLPYFITILLFANPILTIFGEEFETGALILIVIGFGALVTSGTGISGAVIMMTGYTKITFFNSIVLLVLLMILSIFLIPGWGLIGAAIAVVLSNSLVNILRIVEVAFLHKMWPYSRGIIKPIIAAGIALFVGYTMNQITRVENVFIFLINVMVIWITFMIAIYLLGLSAEDHLLLRRARMRLNRIWNGRETV